MGTGRHIAIVFDGIVLSCPEVSEVIDSDTVEVSGFSDMDEARDIAKKLKYGELPIEVALLETGIEEPKGLTQKALNVVLVASILACIALIVLLIKVRKRRKAAAGA